MIDAVLSDFSVVRRRSALIQYLGNSQTKADLSKTMLQSFWLLLEPLSQMLIYYFLVVIVFRNTRDYAFVTIMTGIVHYLFLNKAITSSSSSIVNSESLLLQVPVPPVVFVASNFLRCLKELRVFVGLFAVSYLIVGPPLTVRVAAYPVLLALLICGAWIGALLTATLVVFLRDLTQISAIVMRVMMYMTPVVYFVTFVPENLRPFYLLNPVATLFTLFQWSLLGGPFPGVGPVAVMCAALAGGLAAAHLVYRRLSPVFTKVF